MAKDRTILHCDCNGFFASVECVLNPELKHVPMAVCGDPESRHGIILAKNELAKAYGIQTAETIWQARKKCPDLVLCPAHKDEYSLWSEKINSIYLRYTDLVEPFSIDESWLDVTGSKMLFGDGKTIADALRKAVFEETGVTISVGVSFNKVFAKMGSDYKKPDATTVITRENYQSILWPLPVTALLFVGSRTFEVLKRHHIYKIGDLAKTEKARLEQLLGKQGGVLYHYANGLDTEPVRPFDEKREVKSVGNSTTFRRDLTGAEDLRAGLMSLADQVAVRLRNQHLKCTAVQIQIKDPSLHTISRQKQLSAPTNLAKEIGSAAMELLQASWDVKKPVRMLSVTGCSLIAEEADWQLSLFAEESTQKQTHLEETMDKLRSRFGDEAVKFGFKREL